MRKACFLLLTYTLSPRVLMQYLQSKKTNMKRQALRLQLARTLQEVFDPGR
jgi:hypothetical protein